MRSLAQVAAIVVVTGAASYMAFLERHAGKPTFIAILGVPAVLFALYGVARAYRDGVLKDRFAIRGGDFALGALSAAMLFGGAYAFTHFVTPLGTPRSGWLLRVYLQVGDPAVLASLSFNGGDLLLVANMALFAVYSACVRLRPNVHWTTFILAFSIVSAIGNLPLAVLEHWSGQALRPDLMTAVAILYTGVFTSTVAYATWSRGIELIGAARAGVGSSGAGSSGGRAAGARSGA